MMSFLPTRSPGTMSANAPAWEGRLGACALPSLSRSPLIKDVWSNNLDEEFAVIRTLVKDYPYVSMDTEFPGVVAKPVGSFKTTHDFCYQTLRYNVNMLKIIQVGITLMNERGEVPECCSTWQFNFRFSLKDDMYAQDSIELLSNGGINFDFFLTYGIEMTHFATLFISSGLVLNPDVCWLAFHAGYDFGYMIKMVCNNNLPETDTEFMQLLHSIFPNMYDVKYLLRSTCYAHSMGLDYLAEVLKLHRFGTAHQAGSDSLLTGHCFFKLLRESFGGALPQKCNGVLYGLSEDVASLATPSNSGVVNTNSVSSLNSIAASHGYASPSPNYSNVGNNTHNGMNGGGNALFPSSPIHNSNTRR